MGKFDRAELEQSFRRYWQTGAVGEDWDAWSNLFSPDALYVEHMLGTRHGREEIRAWIKPVMERLCEIYTAYEWHVVDEAGDRGRTLRLRGGLLGGARGGGRGQGLRGGRREARPPPQGEADASRLGPRTGVDPGGGILVRAPRSSVPTLKGMIVPNRAAPA